MNKHILAAVEDGHPLRWIPDGIGGFGVALIATRYTYENGKVRERKLMHTFSPAHASTVDNELRLLRARIADAGPEQVYSEWQQRQREREQEEKRRGWAC